MSNFRTQSSALRVALQESVNRSPQGDSMRALVSKVLLRSETKRKPGTNWRVNKRRS